MSQFLTTLLSLVHVALATAVTLHVLLQHDNLRSSIGWIGLAWLSPFIGTGVYLVFGINRVRRRALKLNVHRDRNVRAPNRASDILGADYPAQISSLARTGDAVSQLPLTTGNSVELFIDGDTAYPAMVEAIDKAEKSIALSSYIFRDDDGGSSMVDALIRASQRGVDVRVLVDGIGSGYLISPVVRRLHLGGVKAEQFLHEMLPWKMPFSNLRNHKKVLVIDGMTGFAGGMNISADNVSSERGLKVRDLQALLKGPIVEHLMLSFIGDWEFTTGETLSGAFWLPDIEPAGDIAMRGITSGPDETARQIETVFLAAIESAQKHVRILTPYFLPEERMLDVIYRAATRGVKVEILVPRKSNHWYFNWAMQGHLGRFPLDLIDFRLSRTPFDHSKLMTVDGQWGAFGSANWDARSMRLNFELVVECYGPEAVRQFDAIIDEKLEGSARLSEANLAVRPVPARLRDAAVRLLLPYL